MAYSITESGVCGTFPLTDRAYIQKIFVYFSVENIHYGDDGLIIIENKKYQILSFEHEYSNHHLKHINIENRTSKQQIW